MPIPRFVGYVHHCDFCGWRREAAGPAMLEPHCEACGCLLVSMPAAEAPVKRPARPGRRPSRAARGIALTGWTLLLVMAVAAGARIGGAPAAVGAACVATLFTLPQAFPRRS